MNRRNQVLCFDPQQQLARVVSRVSLVFGIRPSRLFLRRRFNELLYARWTLFLLLRERGWTLAQIARAFKLSHWAVLHGCRAIQNAIETEPKLASLVNRLRECECGEDPVPTEVPMTWLRVLVFADDPDLALAAERALRARRARDAITKMGVDTPPPKLKATGGTPQRTLFGDRGEHNTRRARFQP